MIVDAYSKSDLTLYFKFETLYSDLGPMPFNLINGDFAVSQINHRSIIEHFLGRFGSVQLLSSSNEWLAEELDSIAGVILKKVGVSQYNQKDYIFLRWSPTFTIQFKDSIKIKKD